MRNPSSPQGDARIAAVANQVVYSAELAASYADGAPHIKHRELRTLYADLVVELFDTVRAKKEVPRVLDLGAGEGSVTAPFLELGAEVTAVDLSPHQLAELVRRCGQHPRLIARCGEAHETIRELRAAGARFDIVTLLSFLHHVPDYVALVRDAASLVEDGGFVFSFQDPLRYDELNMMSRAFSAGAYYSWRLRQGDVMRGLMRFARRRAGVYHAHSEHDNAEYHVVRAGVDAEAVQDALRAEGFDCRVVRYFSTQGGMFQRIGSSLRLANTFGIIARRMR